jgi:murein DD-endopeptidase MepM/ murein hydrolase activator NlpD
MTVSEIKELNPDLNESKIYIGQELMLSGAVPYLSVQQTITEAYTEEIPYETLIEYDSTMYTNTSKLKSPGVKGSADVIADVTYVNGKETARDVTSYTVTAQPVSAVKLVGTKERPRYMATGTFIKPSNGRFSSGFGYRPNLGDRHTGVDFAGSTGTNIWASDGGVVIHSGWKGNFGYCVYIDHQNGYVTVYAHCSKLLVKKGDKVAQGDIIAKVGNTGRSFGSHVHFEIRKNGKSVNPLNYINK